MQQLLPLHLLTIGLGLAWLIRHREKSSRKGQGTSAEPDDSQDGLQDADLERSATQWLARSGVNHSSTYSITPHSDSAAIHTSTYADVELLAEGDIVYLRSESNVLTALVPIGRHLSLQPLQLAKGKPDAVPTAPLEQTSVWVVRRTKQEVVFELNGPPNRRHVLEADPGSPHAVALGGGSANKRGRWLITPQGLVSARWPEHVLPLQVVPVQLLDARAMGCVKAGLGKKLAELSAKLEEGAQERTHAEALVEQLEAELRTVRDQASMEIAELRAQLEAAVRARHMAERDVAALQNQRADDAMRTKMAQGRTVQLEFELQQAYATVRRQEQQIQGMLADHAEELRTLQQELQIARDANEGLKRAMGEQVMALQGALELRDARLLELEEENDRMDTVLQVIQTQLGGGARGIPDGGIANENDDGVRLDPLGDLASADGRNADGSLPEGLAAMSAHGSGEVQSLSEVLRQSLPHYRQQSLPATVPAAVAPAQDDEPPLWRSLLDLTGGLSLTALKESLAMSRRNTADAVNPPTAVAFVMPVVGEPEALLEPLTDATALQDLTLVPPPESTSQPTPPKLPVPPLNIPIAAPDVTALGTGAAGGTEHGNGVKGSGSAGGAADAVISVAAVGWGSRAASPVLGEEGEFVSAAAVMAGNLQRLRLSSNGTAAPGRHTADSAPQQGHQVPQRPPLPPNQPQDLASRPGYVGTGVDSTAQAEAGRCEAGDPARHTASSGMTMETATATAGGPSVPPLLLTTPRCHTPAQLEYGMEASLTLDSLRRRMRQLEAERDRLELLRASLEGSLPWRAAPSLGSASTTSWALAEDAGRPGSCSGGGSGVLAMMISGGGGGMGAHTGPSYGVSGAMSQPGIATAAAAARPDVCAAALSAGGVIGGGRAEARPAVGGGGRGVSVGGIVKMMSERIEATGAGPLAHNQAQEQQPNRPDKALTPTRRMAGMMREVGETQARTLIQTQARTLEELRGQGNRLALSALQRQDGPFRQEDPENGVPARATASSSSTSSQLPDATGLVSVPAAAVALPGAHVEGGSRGGASSSDQSHATADGEAACGSRFSSSGGASVTSRLADESASGPCQEDLAPSVEASAVEGVGQDAEGREVQQEAGEDADVCSSSTEAAPECHTTGERRLPELLIEQRTPRPDESYSVYDSIDGICNLGSTRTLPSFRGLGSGAMTARRIGHSRQPSCGIVGELGPVDAVAVPGACSPLPPARLPQATPCAASSATPTAVAAASATASAATPTKSLASTPVAGGDFLGQEDDAAVHCDDQEPSPPPAMLLGPLDQLRGGASRSSCGLRVGSRAFAALDADDEDE